MPEGRTAYKRALKYMQNEENSIQQGSQTSVTLLARKGREQGYLTFNQIADELPGSIDPEQLSDIVQILESIGIRVCEDSEVVDDQLLYDTEAVADSGATDAIQQAVPVSGHTTDPVRMYMHDMGSVPLLTRSEEIDIAKRIEEGTRMVQRSLAGYLQAVSQLLSRYDECLKGSLRLGAIVTGFTDGGGGKLILTDEDREKNAELLRSMPAQQETGAESLQDDDDDEESEKPSSGSKKASSMKARDADGDLPSA